MDLHHGGLSANGFVFSLSTDFCQEKKRYDFAIPLCQETGK
jgi:hypothetical protein